MKRLVAGLAVACSVLGGLVVSARPATAATLSTRSMLGQLTVAREHTAGYSRSRFTLWIDADHDGCNTRSEVLIAEATKKPHVGAGCRPTGGKWRSPYDGLTTTNPSTFDIDHLVPLAEAWQSGAWRWNASTRQRYANDLGYSPDLVAVSAHSNRSKGDRDPTTWLPTLKRFDCTYMTWWVAVKWRWRLTIDPAEKTFLTKHLRACGWPNAAKPSRPAIGSTTSSGGGSPSGGSSSASGVRIASIYFDSPGSDTGSNNSLNAEWILLKNTTTSSKTLTGWTLRDASSHAYSFPRFSLAAGKAVRVHTGSGSNTAGNLYWGEGYYIWNNTGDTATLRNSAGTVVSRCAYTSSADPEATC